WFILGNVCCNNSYVYIPKRKPYNCGMVRGNSTLSAPRFNFQVIGVDYDNIPVFLMPWGQWDLRWLVNHPEDLKTFRRNYFQWIEDTRSGTFLNRVTNETWTSDLGAFIVDFGGLTLQQFFSEAAVKLAITNINDLQRLNSYLSYGFVINASPPAHQLLNVAKPLVANLLERFDIHGKNSNRWRTELLKRIPRSQLPLALGGSKDFKPVATCECI
ncbi:unnamed protein product, partial [Allacma fusca]